MRNYKVLIVDDDKLVTWSLKRDFERDGCEVKVAKNGNSALAAYREMQPDVVLLDLRLPDIDGLQVLRSVKKEAPDSVVVMMTAYATVQTAVEAIKLGAADYIKKPFTYDELRALLRKVLEHTQLSRQVAEMRRELREKYGIRNLIGASPCMQEVYSLIQKIAQNDATTVLITGESGTGKDLVAKAIHYESKRCAHPFMAINCGSLPDTLLESELFGHERGAFTDAKTSKKGLFELADKGTVLLDEIGDASPSLQVKLLRFLEERTLRRIGGTRDIEVDVRIVAATNKPLETLVREGKFRDDLYYRLNVIPINLAPLRERPSDIPLLANHFIDCLNRECHKRVTGIAPEAMEILMRYSWPGNVRELRNVLERVMILENIEVIRPEHLPMSLRQQHRSAEPRSELLRLPPDGVPLSGVERELIQQALEKTAGNQSRAASLLHISRHALRYKMNKYQLCVK